MSTTIYDVLAGAKRRFAPASSSPGLDAQLLLAEILGVDRAHVIAHREKMLTPDQTAQYESLVCRREQGEPVAYLLGRRAFYDREFIVTPDVLIPRPETEHLIEAAIEFAHGKQNLHAVDCGTGSGAIAVTFAANVPQARVYATDISPAALSVARLNAEKQAVDVCFLEGDLLAPLIERQIKVDLVMANLPYIPTATMQTLAVSQYEPHSALDGGPDGLDLIRRLLKQLPQACHTGALILLEIGADQGQDVAELVRHFADSVEVLKDYAGHDRVVKFTL